MDNEPLGDCLKTAKRLPDVCLMTARRLHYNCLMTARQLHNYRLIIGLKRLISDHSGQWGFLAKASKRGFETFHMFLKVKWGRHCTQPCTMWLRCDVSPHSVYICNMTQEKKYSCVFLHFSYLILVHSTYSLTMFATVLSTKLTYWAFIIMYLMSEHHD